MADNHVDDKYALAVEVAQIVEKLKYLELEDLQAVNAFVGIVMEKGTSQSGEMHKADMVGAEQRIYKRLHARLPIMYKTLDQPAFLKRARSVDVGGGGMSFVLLARDRVSIGDFVEIQVLLPDEQGIITVQAQVKRVALGPKNEGYEVGVEFLHITDEHRKRIRGFVGEMPGANSDT
jgi:hypothetical protein